MKKQTIIFAMTLIATTFFLASCSDQTEELQFDTIKMPRTNATSHIRSYEEALRIAEGSIALLEKDETNETRAAMPHQRRTIDTKQEAQVISSWRTRAAGSIDTLMYVFNFADDQGFAIVSANPATEGLIAVTEMGHYDKDEPIDNPGFEMYMRLAEKYIKETPPDNPRYQPIGGFQPIDSGLQQHFYTTDTIYMTRIAKKLEVAWGQRLDFGQFCPNYVTGCSPIAAAQVMSYFQYPSSITLTYHNADLSVQTLNWSLIKQFKSLYLPYNITWEERDSVLHAVARLCRQLGVRTGSSYLYSPNRTSTNFNNMKSTLDSLGYTIGNTVNSSQGIENYLTTTNIIIMRGATSAGEGHEWVVDGCLRYRCITREWSKYDGSFEWQLIWEQHHGPYEYNHINWGENGCSNGYFSQTVFNQSQPDELDYSLDLLEETYISNFKFYTISL